MAYIIKKRSKSEEEFLEKKAYFNELEKKTIGIFQSRTGRPGEKEEYPSLDDEYWALEDKKNNIKF